eukprot:TRINITY_DN850_c0_g1_i1.p3 TRINITY_DN850_c0_g1~~TRINITY_DN850_c0_g1_i1.p3  ORF type:complete len:103 (+),score=25.20 TRINITY_DN850_c0_g1_i1:551-859(+)
MGGKYNGSLKCGAGWIFQTSQQDIVVQKLRTLTTVKIEGEENVEEEKKEEEQALPSAFVLVGSTKIPIPSVSDTEWTLNSVSDIELGTETKQARISVSIIFK